MATTRKGRRVRYQLDDPCHLLASCLAYFENMRKQDGGWEHAPDEAWLQPIRRTLKSSRCLAARFGRTK